MILDKEGKRRCVDLLWEDLSAEAQQELVMLLGDNGNYDVFPFARIYIDEEDD